MEIYNLLMIGAGILFLIQKILLYRESDKGGWWFALVASICAVGYFIMADWQLLATMEGGYGFVSLFALLTLSYKDSRSVKIIKDLIVVATLAIICIMFFSMMKGQLEIYQFLASISFMLSGFVYVKYSKSYGWLLMALAHALASVVVFEDFFFFLVQLISIFISGMGYLKFNSRSVGLPAGFFLLQKTSH